MKEEKKEPRVYKGDLVAVKDLAPGAVVQCLERGAARDRHSLFWAVERIQNGIKPGEKVVTYLDPRDNFKRRTAYVKQTFTLNVLSGTQGDKLKAELEEYRSNTAPDPMTMTIGCDPEIFVENEDGEVIPAWKFLGSKENPTRGPNLSYGNNNIYWDGFQAEFDTQPQTCLAWLCDSVQRGLLGIHQAAKRHNKTARLSAAPVLPIPPQMLETAEQQHVQFGCMPSKNVYGLKGKNEDGRQVPYRFAGGHIHLGLNGTPTKDVTARIVKAMDAILGVACVSLFAEYDSPVRREYYGLAGEYRTPSHGIEYRTLSNAWLFHPLVMNLVYDLGRRAVAYGNYACDNWKAAEDEVIVTIQTCDVDRARSILQRNKRVLERMLLTYYPLDAELAASMYSKGIEQFIAKPSDITGNWDLEGTWKGHCDGPGKNWKMSKERLAKGEKV